MLARPPNRAHKKTAVKRFGYFTTVLNEIKELQIAAGGVLNGERTLRFLMGVCQQRQWSDGVFLGGFECESLR